MEGVDSQAETIQVSFVTPAARFFSAGLLPAGPVSDSCSVERSQSPAQADDWTGLCGLLCFRTLTVQEDPRSRSTNSVQGMQLRVVPGLRRYSTFTRGSITLLMTLTDLIVISDVTVASTMWNFYRFRVGGTCPLAGQPRIFWSWGWVTVK